MSKLETIRQLKGEKTFLVTCPGCGRMVPINPNKHRNRKKRYCPRCRTVIPTSSGIWRPNLDWIRRKVDRIRTQSTGNLPNMRRDARSGSKN